VECHTLPIGRKIWILVLAFAKSGNLRRFCAGFPDQTAAFGAAVEEMEMEKSIVSVGGSGKENMGIMASTAEKSVYCIKSGEIDQSRKVVERETGHAPQRPGSR
jgi:hypothetical protein